MSDLLRLYEEEQLLRADVEKMTAQVEALPAGSVERTEKVRRLACITRTLTALQGRLQEAE